MWRCIVDELVMSSFLRDVVAKVSEVFAFLLASLHNAVHVVDDEELISSTRISDFKLVTTRHKFEILDADDV